MCKRLAVACACLVLLISAHQALAEGGFEARADLPPLLEFNDGSVVQTRAQLERRKKEVSELLQRYFIGTFPDKAPALLSAKVLQESRGEDGGRFGRARRGRRRRRAPRMRRRGRRRRRGGCRKSDGARR